MSTKKNFNSKNLSIQIESLLMIGKTDLVMDILQAKELKGLLPNILKTLKRKQERKADFDQTKIFSKTDVDKEVLKKLEKTLSIEEKNTKIIIDNNLSAGIKIKSGGKVIDATLETMLQNQIEKLLAQN